MNEYDKTISWQELYEKYQVNMEKFTKLSEDNQKKLIMENIIYDIQAMQKILKTLEPSADNTINLSAYDLDDSEYLKKIYVLIVQLQYTFADMNNKLFGVIEEDTEMINELNNSHHK